MLFANSGEQRLVSPGAARPKLDVDRSVLSWVGSEGNSELSARSALATGRGRHVVAGSQRQPSPCKGSPLLVIDVRVSSLRTRTSPARLDGRTSLIAVLTRVATASIRR